MAFAATFKLGPPGDEIEFGGADDFTGASFRFGSEQMDTRTLIRELTRSILRGHGFDARLSLDSISEETAQALASIPGLRNQELSLILWDTWRLNSEQYTLDTTTTFTMRSSPWLLLDRAYNNVSLARQVNLLGVYDDRKIQGDHAEANRIASSLEAALNRSTWDVTLDTPGTAGNDVYVDYTITGALVALVGDMDVRPEPGTGLYTVSLTLAGV